MFDTATAPEFAEGTLDLATPGVWFCVEHSTRNKDGKPCLWCVSESMTPVEFDVYLDHQ